MVQWGVAFVLLLLLIPASATGQTAAEIEAAFWRSVACESGPEMELYLEEYPRGAYVAEAWACLERQLGLDRAERELIQRGLAAVGHDPGPADGLFSPQTRSAIWAWQKAKGLAETGYVTGEQAEALMVMGAQVARRDQIRELEKEMHAAYQAQRWVDAYAKLGEILTLNDGDVDMQQVQEVKAAIRSRIRGQPAGDLVPLTIR